MEIAVSAADASDVPSLADLWKAMVEHHRRVVGNQWPVLAADVAWERRREQYTAWLTEGSGVIFIAHADGYDAPIGYLACRLLPAGPTFDLGVFHGEVDSLITAEPVRGQGVGLPS